MIKLEGQLKTKVIHGRNGDFTVGTLMTNIGEFSVKDSILDQYAEGEYDGEFMVSKIFPSTYTWGGSVRVEIRAILDSISVVSSQEKPMPTEQVPDPLVESKPSETVTKPKEVKPKKAKQPSDKTESTVNRAIFGDISVSNQSGDEVKLDPTIDRQLFRQQRDQLREMGYHFDAKRQVWVK